MSSNRLPDYLDHMIEAAKLACAYVEGIGENQFLADKRTQQAIILGEAATSLMREHESFSVRYPQVPWRNMKGMRNRIAHGYFDINLDVVWETVQSALPELIEQLNAIRTDAES